MSLWGPALDAEIEYRQEEAKKAWGGRRTSGSDRADRASGQEKRSARASRAEQIKEGIAGMRPAPATRHGLFA